MLIVASFFDVKTREVPDTLSYIFVLGVLGISIIYSLYTTIFFSLWSLFGLVVFFLLGYILYVTKQMGGADVKLLAGLGAVFANNSLWNFPLLISFFLALLFLGAFYTLTWGLVLYIKSFHDANKKAKELLQAKKACRFSLFLLTVLVFITLFFIQDPTTQIMLTSLALISIITFYLYIFIRVVESLHFLKKVSLSDLTEGDWLAKDVHLNNKLICSAKHPCLDKKQIEKLKKAKVDHVLIKIGIPFVPAILLATIFTYILYFFF